jgi:hypothetical protein
MILSFMCMAAIATAQDAEPDLSEKQQENVKALEIAFLTKELELTPDEAQKFWPVYNQYSTEINGVVKNIPDVIERDEKILNIRKKYQGQFVKVLGDQQRLNRMFNAKDKFRKLLIRTLQKRQMKKGMKNRPGLRNN